MKMVVDIFDRLARESDPAVDIAVAAALPTADEASIRRIARFLLDRPGNDGKATLIANFHLLPAPTQLEVVQHVSALDGALRSAAMGDPAHGPANALRLIALAGDYRQAYLVGELLTHAAADIKDQAAVVLLELTRKIAAEPQHEADGAGADPQPARPRDMQVLGQAVEEAVENYRRHQRPNVLLALCTLAPAPAPRALRHLADPRQPAHRALVQVIEAGDQPAVWAYLPALLRVPALGGPIRRAVARMGWQHGVQNMLSRAHLLLIPSFRQALAKLDGAELTLPLEDQAQGLTPAQAHGLLFWISALALEPGQQVAYLARFNRVADRMARLGALRRLMMLAEGPGADAADDVISGFCEGDDPALCRLALRHLARRRWPGMARLLVRLIHDDRDALRELAGQYLAKVGFDKLWQSWPHLAEVQQLAAGRALIKIHPLFHARLAEKLGHPERACRLRALSIIHGLNQGTLFEGAILMLAADPDAVLAASAVRALGCVSSPAATRGLERALEHSDSRVRANAIEALQEQGSKGHLPKLLAMAQQEDNRPRANAIGALLPMQTLDALNLLAAMLADPRPQQRISALWLVEVAGLIDLARHVTEVSIGDPDGQVRTRAAGVIQKLLRATAGAEKAAAPAPDTRSVA